jgi:ubiquinone biosynthesis protein UbiJ
MFTDVLFEPFKLFLNRGLSRSTAAQALVGELEGRTLGFVIEGTPLDLRLKVRAGRISVELPDGAAPDAVVSGSPLSLGRLLREDPQAPIRDGSVKMTGDTDIAERFRDLLRLATPNLEDELRRLVGDPIARGVSEATRAFSEWGQTAAREVEQSVSDYLQSGSRALPTRAEVDDFARRVDTLVDDVERAAARIERLEKRGTDTV